MNKFNVSVFFAALLIVGACAEPRKMLANTEGSAMAEAAEHQRILAELEEVHALRERMLQEGKACLDRFTCLANQGVAVLVFVCLAYVTCLSLELCSRPWTAMIVNQPSLGPKQPVCKSPMLF